jgi:hypothetical protein
VTAGAQARETEEKEEPAAPSGRRWQMSIWIRLIIRIEAKNSFSRQQQKSTYCSGDLRIGDSEITFTYSSIKNRFPSRLASSSLFYELLIAIISLIIRNSFKNM